MSRLYGLTDADVTKRLQAFGPNVLPEKPPTSDLTIFIRQLQSPLIYILIIAAVVSWYLHDTSDALIIMLAVVLNTILGFYQEHKAEQGLAALKKILSPHAKVVRNGMRTEVLVKDLVPGDLVVITSGDKVPADGYLLESASLTVNEAILTGESVPVTKKTASLTFSTDPETGIEQPNPPAKQLDKKQMVFMGTTVVAGVGTFLIAKTAVKTEMGKIAIRLSETEDEETPLQRRFRSLAKTLTYVVIAAALFIFISGLVRGESFVSIFTTSVAVAVAAIPEGLVIALTTILALGMQRILKRKALVRRLVVAETLGTVTVIATDKTGTLTEGKLTVSKTFFPDKKEALLTSTLANQLLDPLEIALWDYLSKQAHFDPDGTKARFERTAVLPFDSKHKFSASFYDHTAYLIGAPELFLEKTNLSPAKRKETIQLMEQWANEGLRVLALAQKKKMSEAQREKLLEQHDLGMVSFVGLVAFVDPVRKSVKEAIENCQKAGIAVKIVTGDYRSTAESVLRQIGIKLNDPKKQILEGEELKHISDTELKNRVDDIILFARVSPEQKLQIVDVLKQRGEVVALLGDGVNDAPAIKRADIGIVVGEASDVARETADLVLLDSNFATIVAAVEEGRGIFANIQKVLTYLLSDTFAEVTLIFLGLIFGVPLPLTAAQILWINLVTDTLPTLALTVEPKDKDLLRRKPIESHLPILGNKMFVFLSSVSLLSGCIVFFVYMYMLKATGDVTLARTIAFATFGVKSLVYVFSLRNIRKMIWNIPLFSNRWLWVAVGAGLLLQLLGLYGTILHGVLETQRLGVFDWLVVVATSLIILFGIETIKAFRQFLKK